MLGQIVSKSVPIVLVKWVQNRDEHRTETRIAAMTTALLLVIKE